MQYPKGKSLLKPILFILNGFLVAHLVFFYTQHKYEAHIFSALASYVQRDITENTPGAQDSLIVKSLHLVHFIEERHCLVFSQSSEKAFNSSLINPVMDDLLTGNGACGSYSFLLARLLKELNIPVRFAQMKVGPQYGGHITIEAKSSYGWVALDALYDQFFTRPDGKLASFADVSADWAWYSQQVPKGYEPSYKYEGVRYTNWNKIPVLMPLAKNILYLVIGKKATDTISLRSLFLERYFMLLVITVIAYLLLCVYTIRIYGRAGKGEDVVHVRPAAALKVI